MATLQVITDELRKTRLLYQRQISEAELGLIALEWSETLADIPDALFIRAVRKHRSRSGYWPTEADIRAAAGEVRDDDIRAARRDMLALPMYEVVTPEMAANNARQARAVIEKLTHGMRA